MVAILHSFIHSLFLDLQGGTGGVRGVGRVLAKLQRSIEAGNYYEAHQMYKTLYFR